MNSDVEYLVIGAGLAGLFFSLKVADRGKVLLVSKGSLESSNSQMAQGGISAVSNSQGGQISDDDCDSFENHIQDTLDAGAGLCNEEIVRQAVEEAPDRITDLVNWGVRFDQRPESEERNAWDLTREGGHSKRRILHVQDHTGRAIQEGLIEKVKAHPNIEILEGHMAIDLITSRKVQPLATGPIRCLGAYVFDYKNEAVKTIVSKWTVLATGGAGKVYKYTSNWSGATGDGIAMAYRAGARVTNLEFMQFHPTCLYHPHSRNFLISEAVRGEGGELVNARGEAFMKKFHPQGSLAPRDIVARSIDAEIKRTGAESVFIDISHKDEVFLRERFPVIFERCKSFGIDMAKDPIPVVPAAHYLCGGILTDKNGLTDIGNLLTVGESACNGFHGANRLASNSLLDCTVLAHRAAQYCIDHPDEASSVLTKPEPWRFHSTHDQDEMIVISHMWEEIRRLMWNYVGIVRSIKRLERAQHRLQNLRAEIKDYYWNFRLHPDIIELRNISIVADLTVRCALMRKESRGIHFNLDYPEANDRWKFDTIVGRGK